MNFADRRILVLGLDLLARKHFLQINGMNRRGWNYTIALTDPKSISLKVFQSLESDMNRFVSLPKLGGERIRSVRKLLGESYHHVELYACRRSVPYLAFPQLGRHPLLVVERGDLSYYNQYDKISQLALRQHYRRADLIWFKEPYMEALLQNMGNSPRMFIPNPAPSYETSESAAPRDIDFVWANRFLPERSPEKFVAAIAHPELLSAKAAMLGLRDVGEVRDNVIQLQKICNAKAPANLEIFEWTDPIPYFRRARFFVMLGRQIFGNNALLEAMSMGVIPIVSRSFGIDALVEDGINGFIVEDSTDEQALVKILSKAFRMGPLEEAKLRGKAASTVKQKFGEDTFLDLLEQAYKRVAPGGVSVP